MSVQTASTAGTSAALHFIGKKEEIMHARRVTRSVSGRDVLILYHQETFHALDMRCYHAGGNLRDGDIEDIVGRLCIVCPWHKYKITLEEGEGLYQAVDPNNRSVPPKWTSKGKKQRIHTVKEVNGDLYVLLNEWPGFIDSDHYQTEKYRTAVGQ